MRHDEPQMLPARSSVPIVIAITRINILKFSYAPHSSYTFFPVTLQLYRERSFKRVKYTDPSHECV